MNQSILAVTVASLLSYTSYSYAQSNTADETMVVTANRFEQIESTVLAPISVVTREEIEIYQAKSLTEILRRLPGVEIAQNGGRGHKASIFIRGTTGDHALVLMDGVRLSSSAGGVSFNHIPVGLIERVEVIRGPVASRYGSEAVGGVINIITRTHRGDNSKSIEVGTGSNDSKSASFTVKSDAGEKGHVQVAGGFEQTDGYDFKKVQDGTDYGYESQNIMLAYEYEIAQNLTSYVAYNWLDSTVDYDEYGSVKKGATEANRITGQLNYAQNDYQSLLSLNYQKTEKKDYKPEDGKDNADTSIDTDLLQAQWANLYQINDMLSLGGGVDFKRESLSDDSTSRGQLHTLAGEFHNTTGLYSSAQLAVNDWTFEGNVRFDKHDEYDNYTTWSLAAGYQLTDQYQIRASHGTSFKAPNFSSLIGNPELKPEEGISSEVTLSGIYSFANWELTAYRSKIDNLIIWYDDPNQALCSDEVYSWGGCSLNENATINGLELEINFDTGPFNHTLIAEYKDHKDDNDVQLARRAKENYKWITIANIGDFDMSATYTYTGKRLDLPTPTPTSENYIPGTSLWDISLGYWLADNFVLRGRVDNLFNEQYETAQGYRAGERAVYVTANMEF